MAVREEIDIEALLIRAYYEKAIHRLGDVGKVALGLQGPKGAGGGYSTDDKVDTSSFACRAAAEIRQMQGRLANAPAGLLDLHDVVLGLENFYIEAAHGLDFAVWDADTAEAMGQRIEVTRDGATIVKVRPRGGVGPGRADLIADGAPRRLTTIVTSTLMVQHGRYADRPHVPEVQVARMRPVYEGNRKEAVRHEPVYVTPLHAVVEGRAAYAVWHTALGLLAQVFACSPTFAVTGPSAPAEPWQAPARVLPGLTKWDDGLVSEDAPAPRKRRARKATASPESAVAAKACAA